MSSREKRKKRKKRKKKNNERSWVHKHVNWIRDEEGRRTQFECTHCNNVLVESDGSTGNTNRQIKNCEAAQVILRKEEEMQPKISALFKPVRSLPLTSKEKATADDALVRLITEDLLPISIVRKKGFRRFVETLRSTYILPTHNTLRERILRHYGEAMVKISHVFQHDSIVSFAATSDMWTCQAQSKGYMSLTLHWISENWKLLTLVVCVSYLKGSHSADAICDSQEETLKSVGVLDKLLAITSDNDYTMLASTRMIGADVKHCFAHCLQLVADVLLKNPEFKQIVEKARALVFYVSNSILATDFLWNKQSSCKLGCTKSKNSIGCQQNRCLVKDVPTRWNSCHDMLKRLLEERHHVEGALREKGWTQQNNTEEEELLRIPSLENYEKLRMLVKLLQPLADMTKMLSGEIYPTIGMVTVAIIALRKKYQANRLDSEFVAYFRREIFNALRKQKYFPTDTKAWMLTALDPRYKHNVPERERRAVSDLLTMEFPDDPEESSEHNDEDTNGDDYSGNLLEEYQYKPRRAKCFDKEEDVEVTEYFTHPGLSKNSKVQCPLAWWKLNEDKFPRIAYVARQYLAIQATSCSSERTFSKAGYLTEGRKNRLGSDMVNAICVLNSYYSLERYLEDLS